MMSSNNAIGRTLVACVLCCGISTLQAQERAAEVSRISGTATAISESGQSRDLSVGADLFKGDRIETADDSSLGMKFTDGSEFNLGESAAMSVDAYAYQENAATNTFSSSIFKGVFRFVSGFIARQRSRSMGVRTAVATIGIRGTHVAGEVDATSARIMLLAPEGESRPTSIDVSNDFGSVVIDEPGFGTEVPDANSAPSPPRRMQLRTVQNLMRTLQSVGRIRPPRIR
ncbi:MAG: hypothetical protein ACI8W7_000589 [Gammaproteobacteria bacterium]|jgi:hypothetical protein